jgi:hypothetical protein
VFINEKLKAMKNLICYIMIGILATSCAGTYKEIGELGMLADHKVNEEQHYKQLTTASGSNKKVIRKSKACSMQAAIDKVISKVPGGEYITNVKVYTVKKQYLAVSGDVWGKDDLPFAKQDDKSKIEVAYSASKALLAITGTISFAYNKK